MYERSLRIFVMFGKRFERQKVRLVGVSRDDQASHEKFAREHKIPFTLIADGDAKWAKAFGVRTTFGKFNRVSFLFDKSGKLARIYRSVDPGGTCYRSAK